MRLRRFYQLTILFPLLGLGLVAALNRGDADLMTGLAEGGRAYWLYPRSATRGLLAYGAVAVWLLLELRGRSAEGFGPVLWRAPLVFVAALILLLMPLVLIHGNAHELFSEQGRPGMAAPAGSSRDRLLLCGARRVCPRAASDWRHFRNRPAG